MKDFEYTVKDEQGIHARPAGLLVKEAAKFPCSVSIENKGKNADAKKIFSVMSLGIKCGEQIVVKVNGEQEDEAIVSLSEFIQNNL